MITTIHNCKNHMYFSSKRGTHDVRLFYNSGYFYCVLNHTMMYFK